jgi:aminopeptidase N
MTTERLNDMNNNASKISGLRVRLLSPLLICTLLLGACNQSRQTVPASSAPLTRVAQASLDQAYAAQRAQQITKVDYDLVFTLDETNSFFTGKSIIHFELAKNNTAPVTVDFDSGTIKAVRLNGAAIPWHYEKWFIEFAPELFRAGKNILEIEYERPYATAGDGLHRFKDPTTGNVYLYSNCEPYNANKMYPHFDQPDMKASYKLQVTAPASWQVVSALREQKITRNGAQQVWDFPQTARIPSYIFPLHAGAYRVWEDNSGSVPLRLFARQEMAQYVNPEEWFLFTRQSFDFFNEYFEQPYPFVKYDQLVVPDFNSGAMENLGAVTFNETFVSRGVKTRVERIRHGNVIAHEMAHMWFGNLVTMEWWNGLWLNESFATYMAYLQQSKASEFGTDVWDIFYSNYKQLAYTMDQQVITHPIELPIINTAEAFTNFDSITYGKGASVLKQLAQLVGEENFRKGVASYLKKYAYQNTRQADFINEIARASGRDLTDWSQTWLAQAGLNKINVEYQCDPNNSTIASLALQQTAPADLSVLREQRVQLGFYKIRSGQAQLLGSLPVTYTGATTPVAEAKGLPCPDLVFPNVDDWGYVRVELDKKSMQVVREHINLFDAGLRIMLWQNLWDEVVDARLPLTEYLALAARHSVQETRVEVVAALTGKLKLARDYVQLMEVPEKTLAGAQQVLEQLTFANMNAAVAGSDVQKLWFDNYVYSASSAHALAWMRAQLMEDKKQSGDKKLAGLVLDQDRRWALIVRLNQYQYKDYRALTVAEQKKDSSDTGVQMALVSEVVRPQPEVKANWFTQIIAPEQTYKLATMRLVMANYLPFSQPQLRSVYVPKLLAALPEMSVTHEERFMLGFFRGIFLRGCTAGSVARLTEARDQARASHPLVYRSLRVEVQEDERCVAMKQLL